VERLPEAIEGETELDDLLSVPSPQLVDLMRRLEGDVMILGIGGKMGSTLGGSAVRATEEARVRKRVFGVSRFSDSAIRDGLEARGVQTLACDLLDRDAVGQLPPVANVVYMVGRKFGTQGREDLTWATNILVPDYVAHHFAESRVVAFSTGCVYPLVPAESGGCTELSPPAPVGEYAQSSLGRERIFDYWSRTTGMPVCLVRLNYAIDLRYGVLHDVGSRVAEGEPVDLSVSHFNVIWQGDAACQALLCLDHCSSPPEILNVTGPETVSVRYVAETFGRLFGTEVRYVGEETSTRMYLSNAARAASLFGYPRVPLLTLIQWQAAWIKQGGRSLGKPTHYGVVDGQF
jgi:nucleoside-diphosphate-sugar epimerase